MALNDSQKASRLFKKSLGAGETILARDFFEEPKLGNNNILPSQIWTQADQIPATAPVLTDGEISGVTQYFSKLALIHVAGSTNLAYYHSNLVDTIPFNYSDGSYNYSLYKNDGTTQIPFGQGDWLVDTSAGLLTFYGTLPAGVTSVAPPKISFYKYVGTKGLSADMSSGVTSLSTALSIEISGRTSVDESMSSALSTEITTRESESLTYLKLSGGTMVGSIDMAGNQVIVNVSPVSNHDLANKEYVDAIAQGVSVHTPVHVVSTEPITLSGETTIDGYDVTEGEFVLVAGQTNAAFNGIYVVHSGTTGWTRRPDADGNPNNEIELGDFVFVQSGITNISTGWALGKTDAPTSQTYIIPDVDTQYWYKMAAPGTYSTDGEGIELNGTVFSLKLDGNTLSKSATGLKLSDTLSTVISDNTTNISTVSSDLSTEIEDRTSTDSSLSTSILTLSGTTTGLTSMMISLSTVVSYNSSVIEALSGVTDILASEITTLSSDLSTETSNRVSGDESLANSITGVTSSVTELSTSISIEISSLVSTDTVLSTLISTVTSDITTMSTEISLLISTDSSLVTVLSGTITGITSLSTAVSLLASTDSSLSTAITGLTGSLSTLSTALLSETSERISADTSIMTVINNLSGVTSETAGSGLTYNSTEKSLNVNVDNWTIRIINDTIVGAQQWIQDNGSINVAQGTSGATITLAKDPVTPVSAYVNGIEYLVNPSDSGPSFNRPFFYNEYPPVAGTQIWFDTVTAGFDIVGGIDVVMIKYLIVENLIQ